ncbi:MAG: hypothetical protein RMY34_17090 [Aulosira sp. DedQUE10]|nr:hypothetical protein [Aulosira sp. DedQUE10]
MKTTLQKSLAGGCRYFQNRYGYSEFWQTAWKQWLTSPVLQADLVYFCRRIHRSIPIPMNLSGRALAIALSTFAIKF